MASTIKDVAKLAGVGQATISSYINGGNVREKNKIKIEKAIKELNFEVNEIARGLKTNKTKTIGIIIPELDSNFYAEICMKIEDLLRNEGYAIIITDSRSNGKREDEAIDFLQKKRVDGLIIVPATNESKRIKKFMSLGKPVILLDRLLPNLKGCGCIVIDNLSATYMATNTLISKGHKNIGIILGPKEIYTSIERKKGYVNALKDNKISINNKLIHHGNYSIPYGITAIKDLIKKNPNMTAIIFTNYDITVGGVIGLNELGVNIPRDLAVIGFDSYAFAKAVTPNLHIILQPLEKIAKSGTSQLLMRLKQDSKDWESQVIKLDTEFVKGLSV